MAKNEATAWAPSAIPVERKRVLVVREADGDDVAVEYTTPVFETMAQAEQFFGADYLLRKVNRLMESERRAMELARYRRNHQ